MLPLQLLSVAALILWLANVVWAFRDARRRGRSGTIIAALVGCTFPLGAALWYFARPEELDPATQADPDPDAELKRRANGGTL